MSRKSKISTRKKVEKLAEYKEAKRKGDDITTERIKSWLKSAKIPIPV